MAEILRSVGLDVGTTSTQMILSELTVENRAGAFSVPEMEIGDRKLLYKSPVHFTPLLDEARVDAPALRAIIAREYEKAGITRESVDTGAIIITGETSRKENAAAVLAELSGFAGEFVVATAGPDLESVLAARGSGAVDCSRETGQRVLHLDIGGGTSNLALIEDGQIVRTGCLNVGGRLLKFDPSGVLTYVSPVLRDLCSLKPGDRPTEAQVEEVAALLTRALEMAAGLRPREKLLETLTTEGTAMEPVAGSVILSFSGGVAECIDREVPALAYGDLGPVLGQTIRRSRLCQGRYMLGRETIRATVIGAGCHSTQLSGSTVFWQNIRFPLKNMPVIPVPGDISGNKTADYLRRELAKQETTAVIALPGLDVPDYQALGRLADLLAESVGQEPLVVCLERDLAKALGQALALRLPAGKPILCIDRIRLTEGSFLDVGSPIASALPVVVKTIVLKR